MSNSIDILIGIIGGLLIGFLATKLFFQKKYVLRTENDELLARFNQLKIETASNITKEEIAQSYISKELYNLVLKGQEELNSDYKKEKEKNEDYQREILRLTTESEQKLSKKEIEQNYVAKESFDLISRKLTNAEIKVSEQETVILELNNLLTELKEKEKHLNEKLSLFNKEIQELHKFSQEQFKNLATEVLEDKKKNFIIENKKELSGILDPLKSDLSQFKEKIEATRKEDIQDITSLKNEIAGLHNLNTQLSQDAQNLATALKSDVKMQGNWGEDRLNMILEVEGLQKYIDYNREEAYLDDEQERKRKPDFILKLPNQKHIIIDSKVSLTAYVNYYNASTNEEKEEYLKQHLKSIVDHINGLADKNYQSLLGLSTPDYVFLFMPVESALTLALNQNPDIFNNALKRKIILITPTTLVATLKIVKLLWQKENQVKNVEEIFRQCGELYNKFVSFIEEMDKIEVGINTAHRAYQDAMHHLKSGTKRGNTIIGRFEAIKKLEAKTTKQIPAKHIAENDLLDSDEEIKPIETDNTDTYEIDNESKN